MVNHGEMKKLVVKRQELYTQVSHPLNRMATSPKPDLLD